MNSKKRQVGPFFWFSLKNYFHFFDHPRLQAPSNIKSTISTFSSFTKNKKITILKLSYEDTFLQSVMPKFFIGSN